MLVVRCAYCGELAGVLEQFNAGEMLHRVEQRLDAIQQAMR
jgi:hypothetical protein